MEEKLTQDEIFNAKQNSLRDQLKIRNHFINRNDPFSMRQVQVSRLKQKIIIRSVIYMQDDLFAIADDHSNISIYNAHTYELDEFPNKLSSGKTTTYSIHFYKNYTINPITKDNIDVLCQCFFSNMIVFWDIKHYQKTKQLKTHKIIYTMYDQIYDSVIIPDYSLIAVSHQSSKILAFYQHTNKIQINKTFKTDKSKVILSQQFENQLFSIQYDRKRKLIYVGLINSQVCFYNIQQRCIIHTVTPDASNKYCFDSILIPRQLQELDILEEKINTKMIDKEYDFEHILVCTDQGIVCINLDSGTISSNLGGHVNQVRTQVYHKQSNSILSISCDRRIGIHPLSAISENPNGYEINPLSRYKDTMIKNLCNSISVHNDDIIVVSWQGEIGHYKYEKFGQQPQQLEEFSQQYEILKQQLKEIESLINIQHDLSNKLASFCNKKQNQHQNNQNSTQPPTDNKE